MGDRVEELKKRAGSRRLGTGSAYLGKAWRSGHRCKGGWTGSCPCPPAEQTPFCKGKIRWVEILLSSNDGRWPYELTGAEDFAIIEAMTLSQFEALGLTALVELPGAEQPIRIVSEPVLVTHEGRFQKTVTPRSAWWTIVDLALTVPGEDREEALRAVEKLQAVFS